jgi:hypothetical protein
MFSVLIPTLIYCERFIYFQNQSVYLLQPNMRTDPGNVEIGTEAVQSLEKEYINGIFVSVFDTSLLKYSTYGIGLQIGNEVAKFFLLPLYFL